MSVDINTVFAQAKAIFGWADDRTAFGKVEYWGTYQELIAMFQERKQVIGDCEDFAALCVRPLREAGYEARFILCLTESDDPHCVCECNGMILDNRQVYPTPIEFLDKYKFLAASGTVPGEPWRRIDGIA